MIEPLGTGSPHPPHPGGMLDRMAALVAPPVRSLGGEGTLLAPLLLIFTVALTSSGAAWAWAAGAPPGSGAALLRQSGALVWVLALASPLAAALKGVLFAGMAWGVLVLLGGAPRGRAVVSALLYGEAILSVQALWVTGAALLWALPSPAGGGLPVPSGLDAWVGQGGGALLAAAQQITPFHGAWVVFLALAFGAQEGVSRWRGAGVAVLLWGVSIGLAVLRTSAL